MLTYGNNVILVKSFPSEILVYVHMLLCVCVYYVCCVLAVCVLVIPQNEYGIIVIITQD